MVRPRTPLSRERVLRAAIRLADKNGIDSLSMRNLGQALGVEAMSLYTHVANKDEILDGIVEEVVSEIALPAADAEWKTAMRTRAISAHEVLLLHPWAAMLIESRTNLGPARLRYFNAVIGVLCRAGFAIGVAYNAFLTIDSYVYGFTLQEVSWPMPMAHYPEVIAELRAQIPDEYPYIGEIMDYVMRRKPTPGYSADFEIGLNLILDGFDKLRSVAQDL